MVVLNGRGESSVFGLSVLRVRPRQELRLVVIGDCSVALSVHWIGGRSLCCTSDGGYCAGCELGGSRVLGYTIAAVEQDSRLVPVLLEMSGGSLEILTNHASEGLQGLELSVTRVATKRPLTFGVIGRRELYPVGFAGAFRLLAALSVLYRLPVGERGLSPSQWVDFTRAARVRLMQDATMRKAE